MHLKEQFQKPQICKKKLKSLSAKLTIKSKTQIVCFFWSLFDHFVGLELQGLNVTTSSAKYFFTTFSNSDSETKIEKLRTLLLFFYGLIAINNSIVSTYIQRLPSWQIHVKIQQKAMSLDFVESF